MKALSEYLAVMGMSNYILAKQLKFDRSDAPRGNAARDAPRLDHADTQL